VETGREVFLRNTGLHLRFAAAPWNPDAAPAEESVREFDGVRPVPDFSLADPAIPAADEEPLPEVVTSPAAP
jgi:hypothetical protein